MLSVKLFVIIVGLGVLGLGCQSEGSLVVDLSALSELQPHFIEISIARADNADEEDTLCEMLGSATIDLDDPGLIVVKRISFRVEEQAPEIGLLSPGSSLFIGRVRGADGRCPLVGAGCTIRELEEHESVEVEIVVEPLDSPMDCPLEMACADGECRPCLDATECDDGDSCTDDDCADGTCRHDEISACRPCEGDEFCDDDDPCTTDRCTGSVCVYSSEVPPDEDDDGHVLDLCGGDDCDDDDLLAFQGADRRCGRAVDHDCDGMVDDLQGCEPCHPGPLATINHLVDIDLDARQGLFVVGTDEPTISKRLVYAISPSNVAVASLDSEGTIEMLGSISHEAADPLAPTVLGDSVVLIERDPPFRMLELSRTALEAGEPGEPIVFEEPPWGRPYSSLISDGVLYVSTRPETLWAMELDRLDEIDVTPHNILEGESSWRDCVDMIRVSDRLMCIEALMDLSTLSVADYVEPGQVSPHRQFLIMSGAEPMDLEYFPEIDDQPRFGIVQRSDGLVIVNLSDTELPDSAWSNDYQDSFPRAKYPDAECSWASACEWATTAVAFGPRTAMVLTRDDHMVETGTLRLFLTDLSDPDNPSAGTSVDVSAPTGIPGREDHLFVSGSFVFVATTPRDSSPMIRVYSIDCDGP